MTDHRASNLRKLRKALKDTGNPAAAFRSFTGLTTGAVAQRLALPRQTISQCLARNAGRKYDHVRRAMESEWALPPYSMDDL
tara:strand:+ start:311 stop:556 length:246 start_codon:yes stop_codon:yes gene_type:complete